jgi:hypothetical protein
VDSYQYCAEFATRMISNKVEAKVLDFGCGAGQIVKVLRDPFGKFFSPTQHIEDHWLESRVGPMARPFPTYLKRLFVRKMAGLVFTCGKTRPDSN